MFSKSDKFTSEYCVSIIKLGEIKPIEGKDKIGYTLVNGETIVIRKDLCKEGDVLFYASNETQLNTDFLGKNNLFESSSYDLNSNAKDIEPYIMQNKDMKGLVVKNEKSIQNIKKSLAYIKNYENELASAESKEEENIVNDRKNRFLAAINRVGVTIENANEYIAKKEKENIDLNQKIEKNNEIIRKNVGFFNKTGRVRAIKLGGIRSMGYLFSIDEMSRYNPKVKNINLDEHVWEDFDTVDGELFVKAYVPFVKEKPNRCKSSKRNKKIEKFDRMIKGEFYFHYDTEMFAKCVERFKPTDNVVISSKLHGTSSIIGKVHVKVPVKLPLHQRIWNKFVDITHLFKSHRIIDYIVDYGNVTASRTVIKNEYINKTVNGGFYGTDIWSEYGELIYPYLDEGMILYGEICGYLTDSEKMIQKGYDYGCEVGKNFLMPYRITTTNEDGSKKEWEVDEVYEWTRQLIEKHPELIDKMHPITILYQGTLGDLYPELSLMEHWHENLLESMRNDKKRFHMEKNDPTCINKVPFEGICIRKKDDDIAECFKLKCQKFLQKEAELMDDIASGKEEMGEEMMEVYS